MGSVRANLPIPGGVDVFYFEVTILDSGFKGYMYYGVTRLPSVIIPRDCRGGRVLVCVVSSSVPSSHRDALYVRVGMFSSISIGFTPFSFPLTQAVGSKRG